MLYLYLNLCSCIQQSLFMLAAVGSCYCLTNCYPACMAVMHGYDPKMPSNSISKHLFFKFSPEGMPSDPLALACYTCWLCFAQNDHPKLSIQADLQLVGLTTEKLLPTALFLEGFLLYGTQVHGECEGTDKNIMVYLINSVYVII